MMETTQQQFFQHMKSLLPPHLSMVDEVAEVLNISNDSAYRRIRGDKQISLEEVKMLCNHFKISLDQFLHLNSDSVIFTGNLTNAATFNVESYQEDSLRQLQRVNSFADKEIYYWPKDIPVFYYYHFPELAAFKNFFWMKTVLEDPAYNKVKFTFESFPEKLLKIGEKILSTYNQIPSHEIWNVDNINTTIQQIEYYKATNCFAKLEDVGTLLNCLEKLIDHIEAQAEAGYKFNINVKGNIGAECKIYVNEFIIGDNTVMPVINKQPIVFINHSFLNYAVTRDKAFCEYMYQHMQRLIRKSTLVSQVSEKQRSTFFNPIRDNLARRKSAILGI